MRKVTITITVPYCEGNPDPGKILEDIEDLLSYDHDTFIDCESTHAPDVSVTVNEDDSGVD